MAFGKIHKNRYLPLHHLKMFFPINQEKTYVLVIVNQTSNSNHVRSPAKIT